MTSTSRNAKRRVQQAVQDPIKAAVTVMIDLCQSGEIHGVIGKLDLTTRRYVFTQPMAFRADPHWVHPLEMGLVRVVHEHLDDTLLSPF